MTAKPDDYQRKTGIPISTLPLIMTEKDDFPQLLILVFYILVRTAALNSA